MACRVLFSESFDYELDAITQHLARKLGSYAAARKLVDGIESACGHISCFPEIAPISRKGGLAFEGLREYLIDDYVIVYRVEDECIFFEHLFHRLQDYGCEA